MSTLEMLQANLLSPITLAFGLGVVAKLARSELTLPKELYTRCRSICSSLWESKEVWNCVTSSCVRSCGRRQSRSSSAA